MAAADASVGGKTAVDTPLATNLIGLFNQPEKVYLDIATWRTLPVRQISSGLAETIKHACIADKDFFDYLNVHMSEIFHVDKNICEHIARENCKIKYEIVMKDEKESGLREALVKKLYTDKKVKNDQLRFVVQKGIGNVVEFAEGVYATKIEESVAREIILNM